MPISRLIHRLQEPRSTGELRALPQTGSSSDSAWAHADDVGCSDPELGPSLYFRLPQAAAIGSTAPSSGFWARREGNTFPDPRARSMSMQWFSTCMIENDEPIHLRADDGNLYLAKEIFTSYPRIAKAIFREPTVPLFFPLDGARTAHPGPLLHSWDLELNSQEHASFLAAAEEGIQLEAHIRAGLSVAMQIGTISLADLVTSLPLNTPMFLKPADMGPDSYMFAASCIDDTPELILEHPCDVYACDETMSLKRLATLTLSDVEKDFLSAENE